MGEDVTEYQKSIRKEDRVNGTYSLEQYERNYYKAMFDAVKKANPKWEPGKPFDSRILDTVSREDIDSSLIQSQAKMKLDMKI